MDYGGPAFPRAQADHEFGQTPVEGMFLRDYFAAKAMQGMLSGSEDVCPSDPTTLSSAAYAFADAMSSAILSPCGTYRYVLRRQISILADPKPVLFVMLNPSIADAHTDDATIRRCIGFAKSWSGTTLTVVNLFALRSTQPSTLYITSMERAIGPHNDQYVKEQIELHRQSGIIVVAWGAQEIARRRHELRTRLRQYDCLGTTVNGEPLHPLRLAKDTPLRPWNGIA